MENEFFSINEIENKTKIPHQTIRRYMKIHGHYLVMKKNHKSLLIHENSIITLNHIRSLYSDGKNSKQVDDYLSNKGFALHLDNENKHDLNHEHMKNGVPDTLLEFKQDMVSLHEKMNDQQKFNQLLLEKIIEQNEKIEFQQKYIDERLIKRDEVLLNSLREVMEQKRINAPGQQEEKKKWFNLWRK